MDFIHLSYLVPLLPLFGAIVNGFISFAGINAPKKLTYIVACGSLFISFIISCGIFYQLASIPAPERAVSVVFFSWFDLPLLKANAAFLIDPLSSVMILVVTGVGFLIHLYSIGYMAHENGFARFFAYLNLFCFAMLVLVLGDNLLLMFVGWEGVGLCSYLLIGFWFEHSPNAVAGMKAFIVNRIGDFGFLAGIMILFWGMVAMNHPTVTFSELKSHSHLLEGLMLGPVPAVTLICIFLFIGASGKSAQIPLYVWLPDAMAGPTPVSALIHAATMVTAGVYMIGRLNFLFTMSPTALAVVATVGAVTAVFAATIGFAQNDIKKVLAYSTVSQLGYMFLGMGTGMYATGIFHLVTHAFFKACLFLGAGSVILGMHHEQDIKKMGGLRKYMPITYWTFLAATLALAGVFPLAGFFSKDEILWQAFSKGSLSSLYYALWALGLLGAFGTAFYMFRCVGLTFFGELRTKTDHRLEEADVLDSAHVDQNLHQPATPEESPKVITIVLVVLGALSVVGGFLGVPNSLGKLIGLPNFFEEWLAPVFANESVAEHIVHGGAAEYLLMLLSLAIVFGGIALSFWLYTKRLDIVENLVSKFRLVHKIVYNKYYVDEMYEAVIIKPLLNLNKALKWFDQKIVDGAVNATAYLGILWSIASGWCDYFFVDGAVNLVANSTIVAGKKIRKIQTGRIQHYFYIVLFGVIVALIWKIL